MTNNIKAPIISGLALLCYVSIMTLLIHLF
jgi:hypothetical protein